MSDRLSSRRIYSGRVLDLDVDTVRFPDGSSGELEMIRHSGASAVVPIVGELTDEDPELLLVKQYRYAAEAFLYEIPAGRLEPGEDPRDCASRELSEETGCTARDMQLLTTVYTTPGFTDERIHLFLATGLGRGPTAHEADEFITVESFALERAMEMIRLGEIRDAKTALGIMLTHALRRQENSGYR